MSIDSMCEDRRYSLVVVDAMLVAGLLFGNYAGSANSGNWGMSIAQGMTARLAKAGGTRTSVPHLSHNRLCISTDSFRWHETVTAVPGLQGIGDAASADNFAAAIAAAKAADVTVVTLGALAAILAALPSLHGSCCDSDGGCGPSQAWLSTPTAVTTATARKTRPATSVNQRVAIGRRLSLRRARYSFQHADQCNTPKRSIDTTIAAW